MWAASEGRNIYKIENNEMKGKSDTRGVSRGTFYLSFFNS